MLIEREQGEVILLFSIGLRPGGDVHFADALKPSAYRRLASRPTAIMIESFY
jgi:hypothetical protein